MAFERNSALGPDFVRERCYTKRERARERSNLSDLREGTEEATAQQQSRARREWGREGEGSPTDRTNGCYARTGLTLVHQGAGRAGGRGVASRVR